MLRNTPLPSVIHGLSVCEGESVDGQNDPSSRRDPKLSGMVQLRFVFSLCGLSRLLGTY